MVYDQLTLGISCSVAKSAKPSLYEFSRHVELNLQVYQKIIAAKLKRGPRKYSKAKTNKLEWKLVGGFSN